MPPQWWLFVGEEMPQIWCRVLSESKEEKKALYFLLQYKNFKQNPSFSDGNIAISHFALSFQGPLQYLLICAWEGIVSL
jgi:hypothetical protein